MELYAAVVTSVPFLLLSLIALERSIFGPVQGDTSRGRRLNQAGDVCALVVLAVAFGTSTLCLVQGWDTQPTRSVAGYGLALGGLMAFALTLGRVLSMYRPTQSGVSGESSTPTA